jgi:hypothetical protein
MNERQEYYFSYFLKDIDELEKVQRRIGELQSYTLNNQHYETLEAAYSALREAIHNLMELSR